MSAPVANLRDRDSKAGRLLELQAAGFRAPAFVVSPPDLLSAVRELGTPLVVRSSANLEDGEQASLAGQFRTFLNLHEIGEIEAAVEKCRAAVDCEAVRSYCRRRGIDLSRVRMEVIVQRMVQPELAGVAFTVNPVTGADEVIIEACLGLGEALLSGRAAPLPAADPLLCRYRPLIEDAARRIQRHFGAPQDVEFAIEEGQLYVLQTRPITRIGFSPEIGQWTNADFRDGGVSSSVCTPLMWSLYDLVWEKTLKDSLRELHLLDGDFQAGRMFFGRPYWNLGAVKQCVARLPGFVEREFDDDLNVARSYEGDGRRTPFTLAGVVRAIPTLLAMRRFLGRQERIDEGLLNGGFERLVKKYDPQSANVESAFGDLIERDFLHLESNYFRSIFASSLAKLDFKASFPDAPFGALTAGLPPLSHMAPMRRVQAAPQRSDEALDAVIDEFRHHGCRGLDIRQPRWDEDRAFVKEMLRSLPNAESSDPRSIDEAAHGEALSRISRRRRRKFDRKLAALRRFVWLREEMRDLSDRMYWLIRRFVLEIARRRGLGNDVFFMTYREVLQNDASRVPLRREIYEGYRNFKAPNEIGLLFVTDRGRSVGGLCGIGAGPGTARGRAFVAHTVEQAAAMAPGAVLVCPFVDPGWTPVLERAAAVVAETGGLLSHAAVICREFGIPAVLGVAGATERIGQGSWVTVHGSEGHVEVSPWEE